MKSYPKPRGTSAAAAESGAAPDMPSAYTPDADHHDTAVITPSRSLKARLAEADRPRERAMREGFAGHSTAEVLSILLGTGSHGESVVDLCQRLINDHDGKLYNIARRGWRELTHHYHGIGPVKAIEILAALELARRYNMEQFGESPQIRCSRDAYDFISPTLNPLPHEEMWLLLLNRSKRVITRQRISSGGTSMTVVDVKMVLKPAIDHLADCIILAHNHPSDNPQPSSADDRLTERIAQACKTVDIALADHLIVCRGGRYYSYCDCGKL